MSVSLRCRARRGALKKCVKAVQMLEGVSATDTAFLRGLKVGAYSASVLHKFSLLLSHSCCSGSRSFDIMKSPRPFSALSLCVVAVAGFASSASAELIRNGNFNGFLHWGRFGSSGNAGTSPGNYYYNGNPQTSGVFQEFATEAYATYTFSFKLRNDATGTAGNNSAVVTFGNNTVLNLINQGTSADFTTYSFQAQTAGSFTTIRFSFANGGSQWHLTNVSVTGPTVPAPGALAVLGLAGLAGSRRRR